MTVDKESLGYRLKMARINKRLPQRRIGVLTKRGRSAVAQWERNNSQPSLEHVWLIAKELNVCPAYLAWGIKT